MVLISGHHKKFGGYKGAYGGSKGKKFSGGSSKGNTVGDDFGKKAREKEIEKLRKKGIVRL